MRSSISGSCAAGRMTVWPSARVAASIAFSVPMTVTNGKREVGAAQAPGSLGEVVAVAVVDVGTQGAHGVDVEVDRPPADPVAAGVADDDPPKRARSGPSRMKLARILAAASSGTNSQSTSPAATS